MAGKVRVVMRPAGARAVLNSPGVQQHLLGIVQRVARGAGTGFEADVQAGRNRAHAMAKTTDFASRLKNAKTNALLKGLGSA